MFVYLFVFLEMNKVFHVQHFLRVQADAAAALKDT